MKDYILSLDVSAACTGWCTTNNGKDFVTGTIVTKPKHERSERLSIFSFELAKVLRSYTPEKIIIEDTFAGINVKTLKILSEFAGVAKLTCRDVLDVEPVVVANTKVKSYFKSRTKEVLFNFACELFEEKDLTFKKDNDIIDAKVQLLYYLDVVLGLHTYRYDRDYGFIYEI